MSASFVAKLQEIERLERVLSVLVPLVTLKGSAAVDQPCNVRHFVLGRDVYALIIYCISSSMVYEDICDRGIVSCLFVRSDLELVTTVMKELPLFSDCGN